MPKAESLNEEVAHLIPAHYDLRKCAIISALFGLDGHDPSTLEEVSQRQTPPLSRERIRQFASPFVDELVSGANRLVWLKRALALLVAEAPCTLLQAELRLLEHGILSARLSVEAILKLLECAGLPHSLTVEFGLLLPMEIPSQVKLVVQQARKECARWGIADWHEVGSGLRPVERVIRPVLPHVTWLRGSKRYFVLVESRNSLANRLMRMLHVSPRIPVDIAYEAIFRDPKVDSARLPAELFASFCAIWPWCRVEEGEVIAWGKLPPFQMSGDDHLVMLIRQFGRPVTYREIMRRARQEGIGGQTVWHSLQYSNVLTETDGRYCVIGDLAARSSLRKTSG
jgi:hypothetical protein